MDTARILKGMGVPSWGINCSTGNYDLDFNGDAKVVRDIQEAADARKWIGICCPTAGRGKTHLAISAMGRSWFNDTYTTIDDFAEQQRCHEDGSNCNDCNCSMQHKFKGVTKINRYDADTYMFIRFDIMANKLAMAGIHFDEVFEFYTGRRCLLLDEIGRNVTSKDKLELMQMAIYELYDRGRQLIFTSPFTKKDLAGIFDGSILDRMNEGLIVELPKGKSYRRK